MIILIIIKRRFSFLLYLVCFAIIFSCNNNKVSENNDTQKTDILKKDSIKETVSIEHGIDIENTNIVDIGKHIIHIKKVDYNLFKNEYEKMKERAYNNSANYYEAQVKIEKQLVNKYKNIFKRKKDTLKVFNKYTFLDSKNNIDSTQNYGYTFDNYYPKSNSCLVYVGYANRYKYILYNKVSSTRIVLDGMPYFSADGNKFVALTIPDIKNKTQEMISYYEITDNYFNLIGGFDLKSNYTPTNARWTEDNKFIVEIKSVGSKKNEEIKYFEFSVEIK